jgi:hypothetical protein
VTTPGAARIDPRRATFSALLARAIIVVGTLRRTPLDGFPIVPAVLAVDAAVAHAHRTAPDRQIQTRKTLDDRP